MSENYPKMAQGSAKPANNTDINHDLGGITYPNLHRRIDNENTPLHDSEVAPDQYELTVAGVNSYRTTKHTIHSEEDNPNEIP